MSAVTISAAALTACGGSGDAPAGAGSKADRTTRRDSAGVEIVESAAPAWEPGAGWRLAPEPRVDIGTLEGREEDQLFRVMAATVLSDGRIAVANAGTSEIRYYAADGRYLSATGGEGEGPGEFGFLFRLTRLPGDTLLAWDSGAQRLVRVGPDGEYLDSNTFAAAKGNDSARYVGTITSGRHVCVVSDFPGPKDFEDKKILDADDAYWLYDRAGTPVAEIGRFPRGPQFFRVSSSAGGRIRASISTLVFHMGDAVAVASDGLRVASADRFALRFVGADGTLTRIARYAGTPRPVTREDIDEFLEQGDPTPERRRQRQETLDAAPLPDHLPTAAGLVIDAAERAWIRPYGSATEASEWTVIDETGAWLGSVAVPPRFRPLEIGEDYVLGVWRDDLDVEHLRMFDLEKGA